MDFRDAWPRVSRSTSCRSRDGLLVSIKCYDNLVGFNPFDTKDPSDYLNPMPKWGKPPNRPRRMENINSFLCRSGLSCKCHILVIPRLGQALAIPETSLKSQKTHPIISPVHKPGRRRVSLCRLHNHQGKYWKRFFVINGVAACVVVVVVVIIVVEEER